MHNESEKMNERCPLISQIRRQKSIIKLLLSVLPLTEFEIEA
jgi:hypothetical protein